MTQQKTWLTIEFSEKDTYVEATLNYETKAFILSHNHNDQNVTFMGNKNEDVEKALNRAKCVTAALKFINQ